MMPQTIAPTHTRRWIKNPRIKNITGGTAMRLANKNDLFLCLVKIATNKPR